MRVCGRLYPGDLDHIVKLPDGMWEKLGKEAVERGMSRALLARCLIDFMLNNPEIIEELFADMAEAK